MVVALQDFVNAELNKKYSTLSHHTQNQVTIMAKKKVGSIGAVARSISATRKQISEVNRKKREAARLVKQRRTLESLKKKLATAKRGAGVRTKRRR